MSNKTNIVISTFQKHIDDLKPKLEGVTEAMPLEEFYKISNNIRTSFFMIQGLCRVFSKAFESKTFEKWLIKCKLIEDALGELDFYNNGILPHLTDEKENGKVKDKILKAHKNIFSILKDDGWLTGERIKMMEDKLPTLVFDEEKKKIEKFFQKEIEKVVAFHQDISYDHMEDQVHEMRRKIRWISIYAQALNGLIQVKKDKKNGSFKKYLTEEIVTSKFNKMPPSNHDQNIYFDQDAFYAVSWIINELGVIKDDGLFMEYMQDTTKEKELLQRAKKVCTVFFEEDEILQKLIVK